MKDVIKKAFTGSRKLVQKDTPQTTLVTALLHAQKEQAMLAIWDVSESTKQEPTQELDAQKDLTHRDSCAGNHALRDLMPELDHFVGTSAQQILTHACMEPSVLTLMSAVPNLATNSRQVSELPSMDMISNAKLPPKSTLAHSLVALTSHLAVPLSESEKYKFISLSNL